MIPTTKWMEKLLQDMRFGMVKPYLKGDVLDFGGNHGELGRFVVGDYVCINYDHTIMGGNKKYDTIVSLATIEHLEQKDVLPLFRKFKSMLRKGGRIVITTPSQESKPLLELMANIGLTDKANIMEHKHYWGECELILLVDSCDMKVERFSYFQFGLNQMMVVGLV